MPLVRVEVRNEYGLGLPELYKDVNREDPKEVLDGVAVAGLVGILRQLGDLAEFAAEVFHGLQEQVMSTASRSNKLKARVQNIEIALAPIEKAVLAQRNHLHFAYTTGSHWHLRIRSEQNHFIYSDLPRFIMDSYEDCRSPPRLNLLDKFDSDGPGSCLKRYSDPTFFRTASASSYDVYVDKVSKDKKTRRRKKKRTSMRNRELPPGVAISSYSGRTQSTPIHFDGQMSPSRSVCTPDVAFKSSDFAFKSRDQSISFDSQTEPGFIDCNFNPVHTDISEEHNPNEPTSPEPFTHQTYTIDSPQINEQTSSIIHGDHDDYNYDDDDNDDDNDGIRNSFSQDQSGPSSSFVTWDEKMEIIDRAGQQQSDDHEEPADTRDGDVNFIIVDHSMDFQFENQDNTSNQLEDIESETDNYMDALNTIESEPETDLDCQTKHEVEQPSENPLPAFVPEPSLQLSQHEDISELSEHVENNVPSDACREVDIPIPMNSISESQDSPVLPSDEVRPVMIWSNGNLLGLEPSKPPDFTKSNGVSKNLDPLPVPVVQEEPVKISMETPDKYSGVDHESRKEQASEAMNSSRMFEFGNRLLVNGFKRQVSTVDENNNHATSAKKYESSPWISPSSSPPLAHMKISFQPSFDTSRLKLKLPDNNKNNQSGEEDLFPSFQLVPEPSNSLHEAGSDSDDDDDSFNRSSPYISDDYSDSNSDNWESSGTPNNRISTPDSVSSSLETGLAPHLQGPFIDYGGEFGQSGHFDLPTFDSLKSSFKQDFVVDSDGKMEIPSESAQPPPPLPPMEWLGAKQDSPSEEINHAFDSMLLSSTISQQPKPAPVNHNETVEEILCTPENKPQDPNKLDEQKTINPREDDFLHQIRAKSLNLRRTAPAQPIATTTGSIPSSVKVTAILEKASAIRQAVGSDDGEDDNWSDT